MFKDISQVKAHLSMVAEHENQENFAYALWREGGDAPARDQRAAGARGGVERVRTAARAAGVCAGDPPPPPLY